jgi:hypothetical protein
MMFYYYLSFEKLRSHALFETMDEASMLADEASVPMEPESSNDTSTATSTTAGRSMSGTLSRKVAKRTFPWLPAAAEPLASPTPTPIDGDGDIPVPVAKKPRLEVPLLATTEELAKVASPDAEEAALLPADADLMTAVSHPMNSDSEQTSRDDGSTNTHSQKLSATIPPSNASGRRWWVSAWEDSLSELADYRRIHGHCNVPQKYSENTKLGQWVATQRRNCRLHLEGKTSPMTTFRIQELESLDFEWSVVSVTAWDDHLSELADYHKIHGHCNVPTNYIENTKLATWVATQRYQYRLHAEGKTSHMTTFRIQELERSGFEWSGVSVTAWEGRLSELADYRKIHGHCNVPDSYSENTKLATWVATQRKQYKLHLEGKTSPMTTFRIQELESLGFEWDSHGAAWEDRLSELADYHKIHGHCNVPTNYIENTKLATWVATQRTQYRLHAKGKTSHITTFRIQELESLGFEWRYTYCYTSWEDRFRELADYRKIHLHCNVPRNYSENAKLGKWVSTQRSHYRFHREGKTSPMTTFRIQELESLGLEWRDRMGRPFE